MKLWLSQIWIGLFICGIVFMSPLASMLPSEDNRGVICHHGTESMVYCPQHAAMQSFGQCVNLPCDTRTQRDQVVIQPDPATGKDTTIACPDTGYDTSNFGTSHKIQVNQVAYPNKILIQFPLDAIPSNATIQSAIFQMYDFDYYDSTSLPVAAYRIMVPWAEGTGNYTASNDGATWYTRDGTNSWNVAGMGAGSDYDATAVATTSVSVTGWYSWNITALVNAWRAGTYPNYGIMLMGVSGGTYYKVFYSSDYLTTPGYRPRIVVTYTLPADNIPPETTASITGTMGYNDWYVSAVTMTLTAVDPAPSIGGVNATYYSVNNGTYTRYTAPVTFSTDGEYYISYYSVDSSGNQEIPKSTCFKIDLTPPTTAYTLTGTTGENGWYVSDVICELTGADSTSGMYKIYYTLDGGVETEYTSQLVVTGDGTHTITYYGVDNAGNTEGTHALQLKIDTTTPLSGHTISGTKGDNDWYITSVYITISASDATSQVYKTYFKLDTAPWAEYTGGITIDKEGTHNFRYYSKDFAGNTEAEKYFDFKIDKTPPILSYNLSGTMGNSGWYTSNVTLTLEATDAISGIAGIYYAVNGSDYTLYTKPVLLPDGIYTVRFYAKDVAGHSESEKSVFLKIDTICPEVTHTLPEVNGKNGWYTRDVMFELNGTDQTSGIAVVYYKLGSGEEQIYTEPVLITSEGETSVEYWAVDNAGNTGNTNTFVIYIDKTAPEFQYNVSGKIGKNSWYVSLVNFTVNATDAVSGLFKIYYKVNDNPYTAYTKQVQLSDGKYNITVYAEDYAGNTASAKTTFIKVDTKKPMISHEPVTEWLYLEEISLTASCVDENSITSVTLHYRRGNTEAWKTIDMAFEDGQYTAKIPGDEVTLDGIEYYFTAEDEAGNVASLPAGTPGATPYHTSVHINYWYLILIIVILLLLLLIFAVAKRRKAVRELPHTTKGVPPSPVCRVCGFPISPGADAYRCPSCNTITHANCIIRKKICPACGAPLQAVVETKKLSAEAKAKEVCGICVYPLEPGNPAYRCTCGAVYHAKCIMELKKCPACNKEIRVM